MGMLTVLVGAVANIVLDPIFIFALGMGVSGAAVATVLSQLLSALWVLRFLTGPKAELAAAFPRLPAGLSAASAGSRRWAPPALSCPLPTAWCRWHAIRYAARLRRETSTSA